MFHFEIPEIRYVKNFRGGVAPPLKAKETTVKTTACKLSLHAGSDRDPEPPLLQRLSAP